MRRKQQNKKYLHYLNLNNKINYNTRMSNEKDSGDSPLIGDVLDFLHGENAAQQEQLGRAQEVLRGSYKQLLVKLQGHQPIRRLRQVFGVVPNEEKYISVPYEFIISKEAETKSLTLTVTPQDKWDGEQEDVRATQILWAEPDGPYVIAASFTVTPQHDITITYKKKTPGGKAIDSSPLVFSSQTVLQGPRETQTAALHFTEYLAKLTHSPKTRNIINYQ